jgi:sialidase-1
MQTDKKLLEPICQSRPCPWSAAHPRHDHQLIFPLTDERLLLIWSEYYANRPTAVGRTARDEEGGVRDDFPCRLSGKVSDDRGRSWSETFTVQDNLWGRNVKHPNLIRLQNGELALTFTAWESEQQRNVFLKRSADDGETWSAPEQISEPGWYCTNNDHILRLQSGRILLPSHGGPGFQFVRGNPLYSFFFISDDECASWRLSSDSFSAPGRGAHEPSIVELKDGRLLCLMRTTQGCVYRAFSADGGDHWSTPEPTPLQAPDSPPIVKRIPATGDLLVLWNDVYSNTNYPRTPLTMGISRDEGETWERFKDIENRPDRDAAYTSALFLDDEVLVAYYTRSREWARDCELALNIYKVDDLYL